MDNNQATKFDNENMQERAAEGADERVDGKVILAEGIQLLQMGS